MCYSFLKINLFVYYAGGLPLFMTIHHFSALEARRGHWILRTEVTGGCWESIPVPLQDQQICLVTSPANIFYSHRHQVAHKLQVILSNLLMAVVKNSSMKGVQVHHMESPEHSTSNVDSKLSQDVTN